MNVIISQYLKKYLTAVIRCLAYELHEILPLFGLFGGNQIWFYIIKGEKGEIERNLEKFKKIITYNLFFKNTKFHARNLI